MMDFLKKLFNPIPPSAPNELAAPADGRLLPVEQVPDPVFSRKMLGDGVAIALEGSQVVAPADGVVTMLFPTGHAFGLTMKNGIEILVHIGLDTVALNGKGFVPCAGVGDRVEKGQRIIEVDREYVMKQGYNPMTIMILTQTAGYDINYVTSGEVQRGRSVVAVLNAAVGI